MEDKFTNSEDSYMTIQTINEIFVRIQLVPERWVTRAKFLAYDDSEPCPIEKIVDIYQENTRFSRQSRAGIEMMSFERIKPRGQITEEEKIKIIELVDATVESCLDVFKDPSVSKDEFVLKRDKAVIIVGNLYDVIESL